MGTKRMREDMTRSLGIEVESWRKRRGLTLDQMAERTDISRSTIVRIESGRTATSIEWLAAIADALEVKMSMLIERAEQALDLEPPEDKPPLTFGGHGIKPLDPKE